IKAEPAVMRTRMLDLDLSQIKVNPPLIRKPALERWVSDPLSFLHREHCTLRKRWRDKGRNPANDVGGSWSMNRTTGDEVWRDIRQWRRRKESREQQPALGEMTLEDFLGNNAEDPGIAFMPREQHRHYAGAEEGGGRRSLREDRGKEAEEDDQEPGVGCTVASKEAGGSLGGRSPSPTVGL
ncbi:hypothetical protein B296_00008838, partial [Ensete ventricosum]